jgi:hypothetical protein
MLMLIFVKENYNWAMWSLRKIAHMHMSCLFIIELQVDLFMLFHDLLSFENIICIMKSVFGFWISF